MIDQNVVRSKDGDARTAAFLLRIDGTRLFSDYGEEYINRAAKLLLVKAFAQNLPPEQMDEQVIGVIGVTVAKAARNLAHLGPEGLWQIVIDVMEGSDEE